MGKNWLQQILDRTVHQDILNTYTCYIFGHLISPDLISTVKGRVHPRTGDEAPQGE
jgi:hypothetical protein